MSPRHAGPAHSAVAEEGGGSPTVQDPAGPADVVIMESTRVEVPCDRAHLDQLRAPTSDVAVPSCTAALESVARLLSHQRQALSVR